MEIDVGIMYVNAAVWMFHSIDLMDGVFLVAMYFKLT